MSKINVQGHPVKQLIGQWQYDGCNLRDEAIRRLLADDGDATKNVCMLHRAELKLQLVKELQEAIERADKVMAKKLTFYLWLPFRAIGLFFHVLWRWIV